MEVGIDMTGGCPVPRATHRCRSVKLRPLGGKSYALVLDGFVVGSAYFERYRTSRGPESRGWVDQASEPTIHFRSAYFADFVRSVRKLYG